MEIIEAQKDVLGKRSTRKKKHLENKRIKTPAFSTSRCMKQHAGRKAFGAGGKDFSVVPGTRGILVSCFKGRESSCVRECYNLFEEFFSEMAAVNGPTVEKSNADAPRQTIEDQIAAEVLQLKDRNSAAKNFISLSLGDLPCLAFFRCSESVPNVTAFVDYVFEQTMMSKIKKTR